MDEYIKERDIIINEIGGFEEDDFLKSGITLEEFNNPTAETISKLMTYVSNEYNQTSVYTR